MSSSAKITVHNLADLKNTTDDALPNYLNSLGFQQSHLLADVRLGLGFSACTIAALTFLLEYKWGFASTKSLTLAAVIAYFALNTILTLWIWRVEKGRIYIGEREGTKISIASSAEKNDPTYYIRALYRKPQTALTDEYALEASAPFATWFTKEGVFASAPFQSWLATEIPAVGQADPKRVVAEKKEKELLVENVTDVSNVKEAIQGIKKEALRKQRKR